MPVEFIIRPFHFPDDFEPVIHLWKHAGAGIHVRRSDSAEEIAKKITRDPDLFLIAEADGKIIGSVMGGFDGRRGMVYHLAVEECYRHNGIGQALMNELETRLCEKGCLRCYLLVTKENLRAIRFYESSGWEKMDLHIFGKDLIP